MAQIDQMMQAVHGPMQGAQQTQNVIKEKKNKKKKRWNIRILDKDTPKQIARVLSISWLNNFNSTKNKP